MSDARTETTMLRVSGFSGVATEKEAPSASMEPSGCASAMAIAISDVGTPGFSARTDMALKNISIFINEKSLIKYRVHRSAACR